MVKNGTVVENEKSVMVVQPPPPPMVLEDNVAIYVPPPVKEEPESMTHDVIPCRQSFGCAKCNCGDKCHCCEKCHCKDANTCGKPADECKYCENIPCGKGCECTHSDTKCVYKYSCGEGQCTCVEKSYCPEDDLCAKNHDSFLWNVRILNANFLDFFNCQKDVPKY